MEKADANYDKHERKVEESKKRARRVQDRAKAWEALNGDSKVKNDFDALADDVEGDVEDDVEMDPAPKGSESLASLNAGTIAAVGRKALSTPRTLPEAQAEAGAADEDLDVAE